MIYSYFESLHSTQCQLIKSDWNTLVSRLKNISSYENKADQPLIKLGRFESNSRANGNSLKSIHGVEIDYDVGEIAPQQVADLLNQADIQSIICSTYTSTAKFPKWRLFVPLSKAYKANSRSALVHAVDSVLGFIAAPESYRPKQIFFIGKSPDTEYMVIQTKGKPLDQHSGLLKEAKTYLLQQKKLLAKIELKPKHVETLIDGQMSVIDAFNDTFDIHSILSNHGYVRKGGKYLSPFSSSGMAGVVILNCDDGRERVYSHHDNDPLSNQHANDAFDSFSILEHENDYKQAIQAAGEMLLDADGTTLTQHNRNVYRNKNIKSTLSNIPPNNLKTIATVGRCLRDVGDGFNLWQSWANNDKATTLLWNHLLNQPAFKVGYLKHLSERGM